MSDPLSDPDGDEPDMNERAEKNLKAGEVDGRPPLEHDGADFPAPRDYGRSDAEGETAAEEDAESPERDD